MVEKPQKLVFAEGEEYLARLKQWYKDIEFHAKYDNWLYLINWSMKNRDLLFGIQISEYHATEFYIEYKQINAINTDILNYVENVLGIYAPYPEVYKKVRVHSFGSICAFTSLVLENEHKSDTEASDSSNEQNDC